MQRMRGNDVNKAALAMPMRKTSSLQKKSKDFEKKSKKRQKKVKKG